jgi:hypothetical protein
MVNEGGFILPLNGTMAIQQAELSMWYTGKPF